MPELKQVQYSGLILREYRGIVKPLKIAFGEGKNMNAAIYIRVSTAEQANQGVSLEAQETKLRAYCLSKGFDVVAVLKDNGFSGGIPLEKRPSGKELSALVKGKKIKHIVALKLDRLFRSAKDCLIQVEAWEKQGIALHLLDLQLDTSTALGKMFLTMASAFAELERGLVKERTRFALSHLKASGKAFNHTPYGFSRSGDQFVPEPTEQATIDKMKALKNEDKLTYAQIAQRLNDCSIPSKKGGKWSTSAVYYVLSR
ncbi:MAG: recombinase family protein [Candidatus Hydrogenedentes bacterium]|nr:recombinase family protein [Candidatus Hydrogenedentota bacterium]